MLFSNSVGHMVQVKCHLTGASLRGGLISLIYKGRKMEDGVHLRMAILTWSLNVAVLLGIGACFSEVFNNRPHKVIVQC